MRTRRLSRLGGGGQDGDGDENGDEDEGGEECLVVDDSIANDPSRASFGYTSSVCLKRQTSQYSSPREQKPVPAQH